MSSTNLAAPEAPVIRRYFDSIARRYDLLNSVFSFNLDEYWRRRSLRIVLKPFQQSILDLGTGTGKFLQLFLRKRKWRRAAGLDFSPEMLKIAQKNSSSEIEWVQGDIHEIPFDDSAFDLVISAFVLRSVKRMDAFLSEIYRVLRHQGTAGLLCLTRPQNPLFQLIYAPYLRFYLPFAGRILSGDKEAYQFLSSSIQGFQDPEVTAGMMKLAGFQEVQIHRMTFGIATLVTGVKEK